MKIVFATNNAHKLAEVRQILGQQFQVVGLADIGCTEDIPETADTLEGNALQKAHYVKEHYGLDCFADDTGLEVEALGGAPGVHTARYAELAGEGDSHSSDANMRLLLRKLEKYNNRNARFRTVIALLYQGEEYLFEGVCEGTILTERHGTEGFGYDPVFQPKGYDRCFAQMTADEKNAISHRGRATQKLAEFLKNS
jgi:XTP/dITP diphosphohydrolase